jgi:uncharacterized repeat protein (TIGR01451 family)
MKIILSLILIATYFLLTCPTIGADEIFLRVTPVRIHESAMPGKEVSFTITFQNLSPEAISGTVMVHDFIVQGTDGKPTIYDEPIPLSTRYSARSWIKNPHGTVAIQSNSKAVLPFIAQIPASAAPGERYAAVMFVPAEQENGMNKETNVQVSMRIGSLITLRIPGQVEEKALVSKLSAPLIIEYGPIPVDAEIMNKSGYGIEPQGSLSLTDTFGSTVEELPLPRYRIFPDAARNYGTKIGKGIMIGKYTVSLTAAYGEQGQTVSRSISVWVMPWKIIISVTLTLLIFYLWRKNRTKAAFPPVQNNDNSVSLRDQAKQRE